MPTPADAPATAPRSAAAERARQLAAQDYRAFDRLARLAARLTRTPAAMVALVTDAGDHWVGVYGAPAPETPARALELGPTLCRHVVETGEPLAVDDVPAHPHFGALFAPRQLGVGAYLGVPLRSTAGLVLGAVCVVDSVARRWRGDDVTDLGDLAASVVTELERRADTAAREADWDSLTRREAYFRALIEHASDGVCVVSPDGTLRYVSPAAARLFGTTAARAVGVVVLDFVHPDDAPAARRAFAAALEHAGEPQAVEFRVRHANGSWRTVAVLGSRLPGTAGTPGVVLNVRDVTEQRVAQAALRDREERFRQLAESVTDAFWLGNADGRRRGAWWPTRAASPSACWA